MRFRILGPLIAESGGGTLKITGSRRTALLGALLVHPGRLVRTSDLVDAVWADRPPSSAVDNIRTYISELRRTFQRRGDDERRIVSVPSGYRYELGDDDLDLDAFHRLEKEGRQAQREGEPERAAALLGEACELWRGPSLEGTEVGGWLRAKLDVLDDSHWAARTSWAEARLAAGEREQMIPVLSQLAAEQPLHERTWELLIRGLYGCGRTAEALVTYARARQTFVDELGIEPSPALQALHSGILTGELEPGPPPRTAPVVVRSPAHRPSDAPVISPDAVPHTLPPRPRRLVGRDKIRQRLADTGAEVNRRPDGSSDATPVVTLSGAPGVGTSAMGLDGAHEVRRFFPDGELYVDLGGYHGASRSGADALGILLAGFGASQLPEGYDERVALYRSLLIDRRVLVVLDNAKEAELIPRLVPAASGSLVIVTSRRRLVELESDWHADLEPLDLTAGRRMLGDIVGEDRLTDDPEAAELIVRVCEGVPLAVRAAGARLAAHPLYPVRALADRLAGSPDLLGELSFGELDLRAAVRESYRSLPERTRDAFRTLGTAGPAAVTPTIAGRLLDVPLAVAHQMLEELLRDNLVQPGPAAGSEPRYRMSDLIRAYARERD